MKPGDLVRIEGKMINHYTWVMPSIGIYLDDVRYDHPDYSPSFPSCKILTPQGVKLIQLDRIHKIWT